MTAAATINDRERIAEALRFYLAEHSLGEEEEHAHLRLLADYEDAPLALPMARELHEHARRSRTENDPPPVFPAALEQIRLRETQRQQAIEQLHMLVREAYELGVAMSVLARWSNRSYRWVQKLVGKP